MLTYLPVLQGNPIAGAREGCQSSPTCLCSRETRLTKTAADRMCPASCRFLVLVKKKKHPTI